MAKDRNTPSGDAAPIPALPNLEADDFRAARELCVKAAEQWEADAAKYPADAANCLGAANQWRVTASRFEAARLRVLVPSSQPETPTEDEEMVTHKFTPMSSGEGNGEAGSADEEIWCADCEYHRDHGIHHAEACRIRMGRGNFGCECHAENGTAGCSYSCCKPRMVVDSPDNAIRIVPLPALPVVQDESPKAARCQGVFNGDVGCERRYGHTGMCGWQTLDDDAEIPPPVLLDELTRIANEIYRAWDTDRDSRVGKLLAALAGSQGYRADIDALRAALGASRPSPAPKETK